MKHTSTLPARFLSVILCLSLLGCGKQPTISGDWVPAAQQKGCFSDTGYYFLSAEGLLHYTDLSSGTTVSLCPKVGCSHEDPETCEGHIGGSGRNMYFWNDGLYYLGNDVYGTHLYRRNADGTALSKVLTLCEDYMEELGQVNVVIQFSVAVDGLLYYEAELSSFADSGSELAAEDVASVIRRIDLRAGKEETLLEDKESNLQLLCARTDGFLYSSAKQLHLKDYPTQEDYFAESGKQACRFYQWSAETNQSTLLFEKTVSEGSPHQNQLGGNKILCSNSAFENDVLTYTYYTYDLSTGEYIQMYHGLIDILIAGRYRYSRASMGQRSEWVLEDLESGKQLPCVQFYDGNCFIRLQCVSAKGTVLTRASKDGGERIYFYIPTEALADGLQLEDCLDFYTENAG